MTTRVATEGEAKLVDTLLRGKHPDKGQVWKREFEKQQHADWKCDCLKNGHPKVLNDALDMRPKAQPDQLVGGDHRPSPKPETGQRFNAVSVLTDSHMSEFLQPSATVHKLMPSMTIGSASIDVALARDTAESSAALKAHEPMPPIYQWSRSLFHAANSSTGLHFYLRDVEVDAALDGEMLLQRLRRELRHSGYAVAALTVNGKTFE